MSAPANDKPGELLTSPARLRKIDLLRDKNIGKYLPLPQLVAVGDQSSGKSSLLESLTGIPFPRGQELCTRYATQITHRRERETFITVSIIPGPSALLCEKDELEKYYKRISTTAELHNMLPAILEEVNELMGIRTPQNLNGTKTFTEDVLKIEKCGPNEDYLTVIDVPGIFRITTNNITTETDKAMVRNMVQNYIKNDQTIILAVLPCVVDIATQEILALAEQYDPTGRRTLGILTKPDLVQETSGKNVVCSLVRGEKRPLNLGYHLVRSRGGDDDGSAFGDAERDVLFKEEPWCSLPSDRLGVVALRQRLQHLLGDLTDKAFPKLRSETRQLLQKAQEDLAKLGQSRQTALQEQQYLVGVAGKFQDLIDAALKADYASSPIFNNDRFRLITNVLNATDAFRADFIASAHTFEFLKPDGKAEVPPSAEYDDVEMTFDEYPDLDGVIERQHSDVPPKEGVMDWIKDIHRRSRGSELVSFNPGLFASALQQQTSKWMAYTLQYVSKVVYITHEFLVGALEVTCSDKRVQEEILSQILDTVVKQYQHGIDQAKMLVGIETGRHPYTVNESFRSKLANLQSRRIETELGQKKVSAQLQKNYAPADVIPMADMQSAFRDKDSGKHTSEEIHDLIKSYYEVARDRFIDNIYLQVITNCLIFGEESPLRLFSGSWVLALEPEKLESIAGESFHTKEQRERLTKRIQDLTEAVAILR